MSDKSNFTPDEWKLLLESVMMAGIAVTAAEPSGLWGLLKESFASGSELVSAKMDPGSNPLIKAVVADFETADGRSITRDGFKKELTGSKPDEIKAKCIETLRRAGAVVDAKAPGDAAAFKGWLRAEACVRCLCHPKSIANSPRSACVGQFARGVTSTRASCSRWRITGRRQQKNWNARLSLLGRKLKPPAAMMPWPRRSGLNIPTQA